MKAIDTYRHTYTRAKETCIAIFRTGKFRRISELECYKLRNDVWRLSKNDAAVKGI